MTSLGEVRAAPRGPQRGWAAALTPGHVGRIDRWAAPPPSRRARPRFRSPACGRRPWIEQLRQAAHAQDAPESLREIEASKTATGLAGTLGPDHHPDRRRIHERGTSLKSMTQLGVINSDVSPRPWSCTAPPQWMRREHLEAGPHRSRRRNPRKALDADARHSRARPQLEP